MYRELVCPLFCSLNPPKQGLFQSKQGAPFGFQVCVYFKGKKKGGEIFLPASARVSHHVSSIPVHSSSSPPSCEIQPPGEVPNLLTNVEKKSPGGSGDFCLKNRGRQETNTTRAPQSEVDLQWPQGKFLSRWSKRLCFWPSKQEMNILEISFCKVDIYTIPICF